MIKTLCKNENSESVGVRSALLLQDYILHEKMAHFNREGIPEGWYTKDLGALGHLPYHDISKYTKAKVFRNR
jgi:catalase